MPVPFLPMAEGLAGLGLQEKALGSQTVEEPFSVSQIYTPQIRYLLWERQGDMGLLPTRDIRMLL